MAKFYVSVHEINVKQFEVEAENEKEAFKIIASRKNDNNIPYSLLDSYDDLETFYVENENGNSWCFDDSIYEWADEL